MLKKIDLFEVLGISTNEDTFTNLMKYLFDHVHEFKTKFTHQFLETNGINPPEDATLLIRTTYIPETNQQIIPDLVLYSQELNQLTVIEVKIHGRQGKNQLKRYKDNAEVIKEKVGLTQDATENYYYLSIEPDIGRDNPDWQFVSWMNLAGVFDIQTSNESLNELIKGVNRRIKSLKTKSDFEDVKNQSFNEHLRWNLWKSPGKTLKELIFSNLASKNLINQYDSIEGYTQFAPATMAIETTVIFTKDSWRSELEYMDPDSIVSNCYDFHVEIRIVSDPEKSYMNIRLDHHLNPYASSKKMKKKLSKKEYDILYH